MPGYETTVVLRPNASEDQAAAMRTKLESVLTGEGGELHNYENWGSRRLAFVRKRENKGLYHYFAYTGKVSTVAELERNLRINEHVLLYLSVRKNDGESAEDIAILKDQSAMLKARERSKREGFEGDGGGRDGGGGRDFREGRGDRGDRPPRREGFEGRPPGGGEGGKYGKE